MAPANNLLIVKNTLVLYAQMMLSVVIGLYTGRVVLSALGVVDYGIYNIAGGVVSSLWFITSALASTSTRYLIYGLGKGNIVELKQTFGNIRVVHITLAAIILLFAETIGLWFVMNKLVIPAERMSAAIWVYQFSVLSFVVAVISAPYNGAIIAHEKMTVFAYISIWESILKLVIVYLIIIAPFDRLVFYALLLLCVQIQSRLIYGFYCTRCFEESRGQMKFYKEQFKGIFSYASWMCMGNVAHMFCREGFNILLNLFYGPVVNAARGLAVMIEGIVSSLGSQFQVAMKPQIIKNYAEGDIDHMKLLVFKGAKFSFFISFAVSLPVMLEIHLFLGWWLVEVPQWTSQFTIVILAISCINVIGVSLYNAVSATGTVKLYQVGQAVVLLSFLPFTYLVLKFTSVNPIIPFVIQFVFYLISCTVSSLIALRQLQIPVFDYVRYTVVPIIGVLVISSIFPLLLRFSCDNSFFSFIIVCAVSVLSVLLTSYAIGCTKQERCILKDEMSKRIKNYYR